MKILNKALLFGVMMVYAVMNLFFTSSEYSTLDIAGSDLDTLNFGYNDLFAASGECYMCHSTDPEGIANVTAEGQDVNPFDGWRSSMMANSARDPFWQAKVSHEVSVYPELQEEIESSCTDCHAPQGFFNAMKNGQEYFSMAEMNASDIALDGVGCLACHQQSPDSLDIGFSGGLHFVDTSFAYAQYESPLISPMAVATGYDPVYGEHTSQSGLCSSCHTLITETVDFDGNITGNHFVEQATYHEWLNSIYTDGEEESTCQKCHLPSVGDEAIIISSIYDVPPRTPFYLHDLVGGNVHMLEILKENIDLLSLKAEEGHFDQTISKTYAMLQQNALELNMANMERTADTAFVQLELINKAGHKFPSGYPARRLHIEVVVKDNNDEIIFQSGEWEDDFYLSDEDAPFEPHHDIIRSEDDVQIYEMVMGDVNGDMTTVLTRAELPLKDNRLVPKGFSTSFSSYDTTKIAGLVLNDPNFNLTEGVEGSGADLIRYHIPLNGYTEDLQVEATVYYQPIPAKWMEEMFDTETPEIESFHQMFDEADRQPILVETRSLEIESFVGVDLYEENAEPFVIDAENRQITTYFRSGFSFEIYTLDGRLIQSQEFSHGNRTITMKASRGIVILILKETNGEPYARKVFIQ